MVCDSYNLVVTKEKLIDILYKKNNNEKKKIDSSKQITKNDISNIIDIIVEEEDKNDEVYCFYDVSVWNDQLRQIHMEANLSDGFKKMFFFKVDDKYIYIEPIEQESDIKQIDYILNNNLNKGKKDNWLREKRFKYIDIYNKIKEQNKSIDVKLKEYDCIKVICDNDKYNNIGIEDIEKSINFLRENQKHNYLTIEEQILLRLIILYGIRNIYLNNTDYYKEQYVETIDNVMQNLENYILFIKENVDSLKDEYKYSFNLFEFLHEKIIDVKMLCRDDKTGFLYNKNIVIDIEKISLYNRWSLNYINTFLILLRYIRYISFDYFVSIGDFAKAKNIFEKDLDLFKYFKNNNYTVEDMINELLDNTDNTPLKFKRNIKVILKFYISCYYYLKYFKDNENADKVSEFLLYFKNGYDIEDFIIKCKYIKMSENFNDIKLDNINNIEEVDKAINEISEKITEMKLVNKFDIDDITKIYNNIDFNGFNPENREKIKRYIATGDKIMNTFNNGKNENFDYSSAVIEWSKAVELEINEKLISTLTEEDKYNIETYSREINSNNKYRKSHPFILNLNDTTIGTFDAIKKYGLQDYLYNEYFSKSYTFNKATYNNLCIYLIEIAETRNNSAHKDNPINIVTASECKDKILASAKILEILSKLEKR